MEQNPIKVSVTCTTYNQKNYIARALDSFLAQRTDFPFEIIVHDDCSTDGTAEIVREYAEKYPDKIVPILQTENQYSKGKRLSGFINPKIRGQYKAPCEGDDYWTDPLKLQKQADFLDAHPDYAMVTHAASCVDADGKPLSEIRRPAECDRDYTADEVIAVGGGLFHTASVMIRSEIALNYPPYFYTCPVGDYPMQILAGLAGKIRYLDEEMSAYRVVARGSWTAQILSSDEKTAKHYEKMAVFLEALREDERAAGHTEVIDARIAAFKLEAALIRGDRAAIRENRARIGETPLPRSITLGSRMPGIYRLARRGRTAWRKIRYRGR